MEEMKSNATDNNNMDSMTDSLNKLMMGLSE